MLAAFQGLRLTAGMAIVLLAMPAGALLVGGGGSARSDCLTVFDATFNYPATNPRQIVCTDGDPACDEDAAEGPNGICVIPLTVCVNSTLNAAECSLNGVASIVVDHAQDNGLDPKFDPDFLALRQRIESQLVPPNNTAADDCATPVNIRVRIKGPTGANRCRKNKKKIKLTTQSILNAGQVITDTDKIKITCLPNPVDGCDPQVLFDGTFDRIQRQIFNQSCAVGGCHDSQSQTGDLLLETGAAYTNLVDVTPDNFAAQGSGWKRVLSGDVENSFIVHKLAGDLPDFTYGGRMPLGRPKLNKTLIDIIKLWIEADAPANGWVPGTF